MFNEIVFEKAQHKYFVNKKEFRSVSSIIEKIAPKFQSHFISKAVASRKGVSQEEVLKEWEQTRDAAANFGTETHDFASSKRKAKPDSLAKLGVVEFFKAIEKEYDIIYQEKPIYHKKYKIAGTPDLVLRHKKTKKNIIADFKTNKQLFDIKSDELFAYPFLYPNANYFKYVLQLNYYQLMLEQEMKIDDRIIVWLNLDEENLTFYNLYHVPNIQSRIIQYESGNLSK